MLLNLIKYYWPDINKIYLYAKDPFQSKYQLHISGRQKIGTKNVTNPKTIIDYSQTIDDVYVNLEDYNPTKIRNVLIVFHDIIADVEPKKT